LLRKMTTATKSNELMKLMLGMALSVLVTVLTGWATLDYATPDDVAKLEDRMERLEEILTDLRIRVGVTD
jgi:hypothetical protein